MQHTHTHQRVCQQLSCTGTVTAACKYTVSSSPAEWHEEMISQASTGLAHTHTHVDTHFNVMCVATLPPLQTDPLTVATPNLISPLSSSLLLANAAVLRMLILSPLFERHFAYFGLSCYSLSLIGVELLPHKNDPCTCVCGHKVWNKILYRYFTINAEIWYKIKLWMQRNHCASVKFYLF